MHAIGTLILLCHFVLCSFDLGVFGSNPCDQHTTCSECVREAPYYCHWCSSDNYRGRCKPITEKFLGCDQIENPESFVEVKEDRDFTSGPNVTQIRPQKFDFTLRVRESQEFNLTFKAAEDYPADLYFLIDASFSMTSVLKSVATASAKITAAMQNVTSNVYLGMGTFIDKNTAPFVRARDPNAETYSFRHRVNMTDDVKAFQKTVKNTPVGTNYDDPEGGFDALAQVIMCKDEIGWREVSRKIIFFLTDQLFHSAGDGKWGGIVRPYDGQCYTKDGNYTKELEMDYPSIGILNKLSADEEVTIVFIVDQNLKNEYKDLAKTSERWKYLTFQKVNQVVTFDKQQLEQLVSSIYKEISHTIKLKVNMATDLQNDIEFHFTPDCYKKGNHNPECQVKKGVEKSFKGNVTLKPHFKRDNAIVNLIIQGIKEKVVLNIKVADCKCVEKVDNKSASCSGRGVKKCGVCSCDADRIGEKCECPVNSNNVGVGIDSCLPTRSALACSGFGTCTCGACVCKPGHNGEFCQCDNNNCPKKCSGNGECGCGSCICNPGWDGAACDCKLRACREAHGKTCNGRGTCTCGKCQCEPPALWDARETQSDACEIMPCKNCHTEQCLKLRDCALCHQKSDRRNCNLFCDTNIKVDLQLSLSNASEDGPASICEQVQAELGCYMRFQYKYDTDSYGVALVVESQPDCLKTYYWLGGTILLTLLIIGLLTLVAWKMLTDLRDRREYNRFLKSTQGGTAVCDNPIYEPASTTFRNPAFRKPSTSQ